MLATYDPAGEPRPTVGTPFDRVAKLYKPIPSTLARAASSISEGADEDDDRVHIDKLDITEGDAPPTMLAKLMFNRVRWDLAGKSEDKADLFDFVGGEREVLKYDALIRM